MPSSVSLVFELKSSWVEKDRSQPTVLRQDGVKGSVTLSNPKREAIDKVKIVLSGYLFNTIGHGCPTFHQPHKLQLEQRILRMVDVRDSASSTAGPDEDTKETFNFDFQLHRSPQELNCEADSEVVQEGGLSKSLPCSLGILGPWCSHAAGQACCQAEALVKYELAVIAFNGDEKVAMKRQRLRIFDCADSHPPPVHIAHFPDEFTCKQERVLRRMYKIKRNNLEVRVAEPKPVVIKPEGETTYGCFTVRLITRNCKSTPKKLDVRVNSLLKAVTFIASTRMQSQPTFKQTKTSPFLAAVPKWGRSYNRKFCITDWARTDVPGEWSANATVWMPISEGATPSPTFFTPYLARRYSVSLRLEVNGAGKAIFNLHVPVQIVYPESEPLVPSYEMATSAPGTPPNEAASSSEEEEEQLPMYVR